MRIPVLAANWKMFKTVGETVSYLKEFCALTAGVSGAEMVVAPPFTAIRAASEAARGSNVGIAAQDCYWEQEGAFTGEISVRMLKDAGACYVIVGHSERRRLFGDTDERVNRKLGAVLAAGLTPIVCIGETLEERDAGRTLAVLDRQVEAGLAGLTPAQVASLVIAYEPVWAIGTGRNATPAQAGEAHAHIRGKLAATFGAEAAAACRILYGGSVKPENIKDLMAIEDVDGALVGGASLTVSSFFAIVSGAQLV
ncbi:MAG TPA: triose-phosphate isomerase [Vicinamibacterales bacterium]|nr:triose-phosphate isomerase [Vicinamibacterales bacterium]HPW21660.1 triose-phosphate isomerase [Vicinamibacterales bacterium]